MITINGHNFYEVPTLCGTCPFLITGNTGVPQVEYCFNRGICLQWNESHHSWANIPRRCKKLFEKTFKLYDNSGQELVITSKEK